MAKGLGKGINAFFPEVNLNKEETVREVKLKDIRPNPYQPRKHFDEEAIQELKESILQHGVLQPIIVRKSIKGFEIVAGERRHRASKAAGLDLIPVVVREFTEQQMMELALLENLQREDLTAIEEAQAYQALIEHLDITQEMLAKRIGKSRPHIANHIRLLALPEGVRTFISEGKLSMGHGRALLGLRKKDKLNAVVQKILKEQLNVRQLEQLVHQLNENVSRETLKPKKEKDVFIKERESVLRDKFGTSVSISRTKKKGKIEIEFFSSDDLNRILDLLEGIE